MNSEQTQLGAGSPSPSTPLLADAFTFRTRLPNGVELELNALAAEELCEKLESFGDDCSNGCKRMRAAIREAINHCTANPTGLRCAGLGAHKQDPVVGQPELTKNGQ